MPEAWIHLDISVDLRSFYCNFIALYHVIVIDDLRLFEFKYFPLFR